jgi:DNA-binding response OmpR family regulator
MNDSRFPQSHARTGSGLGLMIVDDDAGVRNMLDEWLRHQGFKVWLAATGQEAIDLYRGHQDTIDVVLIDVRMPVLDGPRTLDGLRAINSKIGCCFMSGGLGENTEAELLDRGGASFLRKPFHLDELVRALLSLVRPRLLSPETV